jgi:inner membrane protein
MDNLCHTLAGAALGEAGLKKRTALGTATLMIASNLPDIDVGVFATDPLAMSFRRGWTHGVLAMVVLPAALAGAMWLWDRRRSGPARGSTDDGRAAAPERASFAGLLALSCIGNWLHVFMDFLNTYGVRLLMPFSERWFYGDSLYIVDPWLYVSLGGTVLASRIAARRGRDSFGPARVGVAVAAIYMTAMIGSNLWARSEVRSGLTRAGRSPETRFMVSPVPVNPFRREVIVDLGARYEKGFLWFEPLPHFRPAGYGVDANLTHPSAIEAARQPRVAAFLRWSRFPFFVIEETASQTTAYLNDYRYSGPGGRDGWARLVIQVRQVR